MRRLGAFAVPTGHLAQAGTNYLLLVGVARGTTPEVFAYVSIAWLWYAVLLTAARTLVGEQAVVDVIHSRRLRPTRILFASGLGAGAVFALTVTPLLLVFAPLEVAVLIPAAGCLLLIQDSVRYARMAEDRHLWLALGDAVCLLATILGFGVRESTGHLWPLLIAPIVGASLSLTLPPRALPNVQGLVSYLGRHRAFLRWMSLQVFVTNLASQFLVVIALPFVGPVSFAGLRALQSVMSPLSTPASAVQPLVFRFAGRTPEAVQRFTRRRIPGFLLLSSTGAVVAALVLSHTASWWIPLTVGSSYAAHEDLVLPVALALGVVYMGLPVGVQMRVLRLGREIALAQVVGVLVGACGVLVAAISFGVYAVAWALFTQAVLTTALSYALLWHRSHTGRIGRVQS